MSTSKNANPTSLPPPCCTKLRNENEMLRRALHKEREKRQLIEQSYKELLRSYEQLVHLKRL